MLKCFRLASQAQKYATVKDLSASEVQMYEEVLNSLFDAMETLPDFKLNNKHHILRYHTVDFARAHGSLGRFSEQGGERMHNEVNNLESLLPRGNNSRKNLFAMKRLWLRTYFNDKLL